MSMGEGPSILFYFWIVIGFFWLLIPFLLIGTNNRLNKLIHKLDQIADNQEKILKKMEKR